MYDNGFIFMLLEKEVHELDILIDLSLAAWSGLGLRISYNKQMTIYSEKMHPEDNLKPLY